MSQEIVNAAEGLYPRHPESYHLRVFCEVTDGRDTIMVYELLSTGEAIPWGTKSPAGFDFWIISVRHVSEMGVHRATRVPTVMATNPPEDEFGAV